MLFPHMFGAVGSAAPEADLAQLNARRRPNSAALEPCVRDRELLLAAGQALHASDDQLHVLLAGTPRLSGSWAAEAAAKGVAATLLRAFRQDGPAALRALQGAYALALVDARTRSTYLAVDRVGQCRLAYLRHQGTLWFGNELKLFAGVPGFVLRLSPQAMFDYLYFHAIPSPGCIYEGVQKVPPGVLLTFTPDMVRREEMHAAKFVAAKAPLPAQAEARLRETLADAVAQVPGVGSAGAFLSGGLDSSTTAGLMAVQRQRQGLPAVPTFTIGFDAPEYDESAYADITAQHFRTDHHVLRLQPAQVAEALPQIAAFLDEPFGNSSVLPTYFCARHAHEHGIDRLVAGDGGDELFAGNERYAKQGVFEIYNNLPAPLRAVLLDAPLAVLPAAIPLVRKAGSYVQQAKVRLPDRLQSYNFLHRFPLADMFDSEFLRRIDQQRPLQMLRSRYEGCDADNIVDRMLFLDWKFTLADNDLVKVNQACQLAGVAVHYPLLDDAAIELSMQIPARQKLQGKRLRHFYKNAMQGFLHDDTLNKKKHGFGLPFGLWLRTDPELKHLAQSALQSLKARDIVRADFIERARQEHAGGHASYFGELVWLLMMLELWLQQHD